MLEVIDKGSCTEAHPMPLLFVHGGWHGAWCWDEYFLDFFAAKGYRVLAVSLRGHGRSPTSKPLFRCSIADYVDDVAEVADRLPTGPVVIGHSMGGFVVQKYLESHAAPAGVLLASIAARGILGPTLQSMRRYPWRTTRSVLTGKTLRNMNTPGRARQMFFSSHVPEPQVATYAARLQEESARAIFLDMLFFDLPKPENVKVPVLVLGAQHDRAILAMDVQTTACAYRTEAEIFPNMGHDMMLEPGWAAVAERIHRWLETHCNVADSVDRPMDVSPGTNSERDTAPGP
jgi:pimeloyl-ACP methyl ester carboxylesterase